MGTRTQLQGVSCATMGVHGTWATRVGSSKFIRDITDNSEARIVSPLRGVALGHSTEVKIPKIHPGLAKSRNDMIDSHKRTLSYCKYGSVKVRDSFLTLFRDGMVRLFHFS